jgi:GMP synthase (glutamine-hydrolysing)
MQQFHPEVVHTPPGKAILANFLFRVAKCQPTWTMRSFVEASVARIRDQVGTGRVLCGLSGGVDSSVAAVLAHQAIGDRLTCVFVDNGLLRMNEAAQVVEMFGKHLGLRLIAVDAGARFLETLAGVTDPERKRKIIGAEFITVFEEEAARLALWSTCCRGPLPGWIERVRQGAVGQDAPQRRWLAGKMGFKLVVSLRACSGRSA